MKTSNLEVLACEESPIGMIWLRRRELLSAPGTVVTEIMLDHELLMSSQHTVSERALARCALDRRQGSSLRVLIGGLGLGFTAHEALQSPRVAQVDVVELLPQVVQWLHAGQMPLSAELSGDERLLIVTGDVYAMLAGPAERHFDLILIDVDHSPDEPLGDSNGAFYTPRGLEQAKTHLGEGGVLGVWSYAENSLFVNDMRQVFSSVEVELVTFDNLMIQGPETNWLFLAHD